MIEDKEIRTNVRELLKFAGIFITVSVFVYSIKMDIKDLGSEYATDRKVTEIRLQTIELRLSQIEQDQRDYKKQRDEELQRKANKE